MGGQVSDFSNNHSILDPPGNEVGRPDKLCNKRCCRLLEYCLRRVYLFHPSRVHHPNLVTHEKGLLLVVGDKDYGRPGAGQDVFDLSPNPDSQVGVVFFEGSVVLMDAGADMTLEQVEGTRKSGKSNIGIFQSVGRTVSRVNKLVDAESSYAVRTSNAVGLVRGTGFIVEEDPVTGTKWKSFEGTVGVAGESGQETRVEEGTSSEVPPEGDPSPPIPDPVTPEEQDLVETTDQVIEENPYVVVDFWAEWCAPCRAIAPIVEDLARKYAGKVTFAKVNTDENPKIPQKFMVMGIPTLLFFKAGKLVDQVVGAMPRGPFEERVRKHLA